MRGCCIVQAVLIAFLAGFLRDVDSLLKQSTKIWNRNRKPNAGLFAEMRILIHGTLNAWTTLRPYDLILYELEIKVKGKERGIGVYTPDRDILPLCNYIKGSTEFYVDALQDAYSAETLQSENRLLRVVSADRRGTDCFIVEEYLDADILIPIRDPQDFSPPSPISTILPTIELVQHDNGITKVANAQPTIETITSKLEIAMYDFQLLELKAKREIAVLQTQLCALQKERSLQSGSLSETIEKGQLVSVESPLVPKPIGPYSQAIVANGFVFISGCIGMNIETGRIADGGVEAETRQSLENMKNIIEKSGSSLSKVCKTTIMIREMSYFAEVNKVYAEYFNFDGGATALPARSTFEVSFLPLGAFIEIEAVCLL